MRLESQINQGLLRFGALRFEEFLAGAGVAFGASSQQSACSDLLHSILQRVQQPLDVVGGGCLFDGVHGGADVGETLPELVELLVEFFAEVIERLGHGRNRTGTVMPRGERGR
jgi:hypothetical protein